MIDPDDVDRNTIAGAVRRWHSDSYREGWNAAVKAAAEVARSYMTQPKGDDKFTDGNAYCIREEIEALKDETP